MSKAPITGRFRRASPVAARPSQRRLTEPAADARPWRRALLFVRHGGPWRRPGYTAIGTLCNLAARLCAEAKVVQILLSGRVAATAGAVASLADMGNISLKGLSRPVVVFNVVAVGAEASNS